MVYNCVYYSDTYLLDHAVVVQMLLDHGVLLDKVTVQGHTALSIAKDFSKVGPYIHVPHTVF
jgi:hypothetical protein